MCIFDFELNNNFFLQLCLFVGFIYFLMKMMRFLFEILVFEKAFLLFLLLAEYCWCVQQQCYEATIPAG